MSPTGALDVVMSRTRIAVRARDAIVVMPEDVNAMNAWAAVERPRFAARRRFLRATLARAMSVPEDSIRFSYGDDERPFLPASHMVFSAAHDGPWYVVVFALGRGARLGVDIQRISLRTRIDDVLESTFAPVDADAIRHLAPARRRRAFFRAWVRYEAIVKARGGGLVIPFEPLADMGREFHVQEFVIGRNCVGAIAADRPFVVRSVL